MIYTLQNLILLNEHMKLSICKYLVYILVELDIFLSILTFRMLDTIGRENA